MCVTSVFERVPQRKEGGIVFNYESIKSYGTVGN